MKSPSSRYLTGCVLRAILGTFLLLCAISAVRTHWIGPDACGEIPPPWDKALILPDRLVHLAITKIAEKRSTQPSTSTSLPPQPSLQSSESVTAPASPPSTPLSPPSTPLSPTPAMAKLPAMPSMPDMPGMPTTTAGGDLRTRHAELLTAIKAREKQLRSAAAGSNPHREEYVKASKTYKQFALRNNALLKEFQDATGDRRMSIADELRKLKLNRDRVTKTYESAKQRYTAWKEQHPQTKPDLENDPELQRLRQEVANVAQQLATP
jgi:hypothetical protein